MGATVCTERVHSAFVSADRMKTFFHGHSYTGNPLASAVAIASFHVFQEEPVFERIRTIEKIHSERIAAIKNHPAVGEVRSIGTMAAVELKADDAGYFSNVKPKLYKFFIDAGVLLRPLGNVVYVLPPYVITPDELNYVHDQIAQALDVCV